MKFIKLAKGIMMKRFYGSLVIFALIVVCVLSSSFGAFAVSEEQNRKISDNVGGILSISYRGDTGSFPKNSLEAIRSAEQKGADMVSVSTQKTKDGVIVLSENTDFSAVCNTDEKDISNLTYKEIQKLKMKNNGGSVSECKIVSLEKALRRPFAKAVLVLDNSWEMKDEIAKLCQKLKCENDVVLRTDASSKEIALWKQNGNSLGVIGIYGGNIVFSVLSHLSRLTKAGEKMVQYQSKNYFNVAFDNFSAKNYSKNANARAVVPMYSKDLCGQREDNVSGWDEMVKRGFFVIETNDIEGLCIYIESIEKETEKLSDLLQKSVDTSVYTSTSIRNLEAATKNAKAVIADKNASLGEIQQAYSLLAESHNNLTIGEKEDTQRGSLNITAGKVAAVIIFGSLLLAGEVYLVKMRKKEK